MKKFYAAGNVRDWCLDSRDDGRQIWCVVRGGAWRSFVPAVRCAARIGTPKPYQLHHVGLRVVQEVR